MRADDALQLVGRGTLLLAACLVVWGTAWMMWELWRRRTLDEIVRGDERIPLAGRVMATLALGVFLGFLSVIGLSIWFAAMQPLCTGR